MNTQPIAIRMPTELIEAVDAAATTAGQSRTEYVTRLLCKRLGVKFETRPTGRPRSD